LPHNKKVDPDNSDWLVVRNFEADIATKNRQLQDLESENTQLRMEKM
jgi:cell division protein FtsB